ncbi:MAG: HAMP domain-containing sensor histidine kinase [Acidimicrobiia bacterium]
MKGHRRPPWWPHDRPWPPTHPPRAGGRRLTRIVAALAVLWLAVGIIAGVVLGSSSDRFDGHTPLRALGPAIFVVVGTWFALRVVARQITRPAAELLDATEQIRAGLQPHIQASGAPPVRRLTQAFNDMAEQLATTEARRKRLLADISHELRTPLTILHTGIEAQLDGVHPRDDAHLEVLLDQTNTLARLIDDISMLALVDDGRLTIHREPARLNDVIEDVVGSFAGQAATRNVTLVVAGDGGPPFSFDPIRIRQAVANLVANALRYTPAGGQVTITATNSEGEASIETADTGPGVAADQMEQVFDRFVKAADSGGSGLGLAIARDLVQAHGGTLTVSNRPCGGAVFTILLPTVTD